MRADHICIQYDKKFYYNYYGRHICGDDDVVYFTILYWWRFTRQFIVHVFIYGARVVLMNFNDFFSSINFILKNKIIKTYTYSSTHTWIYIWKFCLFLSIFAFAVIKLCTSRGVYLYLSIYIYGTQRKQKKIGISILVFIIAQFLLYICILNSK